MADPITPERVRELLAVCRMIRPEALVCVEQFSGPMLTPLNMGELDALLLAWQRQQETCEWTGDEDTDEWRTSCKRSWQFTCDGPVENGVKFCFGCGRKVQVTR